MLEEIWSKENQRQRLKEMAHAYYYSSALYSAVQLGLAEKVYESNFLISELAVELKLDFGALKRLIHFLVSLKILSLDSEGRVQLTDSGMYLTKHHPESLTREIAMFSGAEAYQAWGQLSYSVQTGQPAFSKVFGSPLFEYFANHKDSAKRFHQSWQEITTVAANEFVQNYDLTQVGSLLDVGSGYGIFLCTILKSFQHLKGALFDLPVSLIEAPRVISEFGLESRTKIIEGDALKRVEPGYEMHLLKSVIHVCNDGQAVQILSNCSAVLKAGQRLLIVERVIPNNFEYHWSRMVDMTMLVMTGGKERTENEYSSLCEKAKLKIHRIIDLPCGFNIIECLK